MKKLVGLVLVATVFMGTGLLVGIAAAEAEEEVIAESEESLLPDTSPGAELEERPEEMTEAEWLRAQAEEHLQIAEELKAQASKHAQQAAKLLNMSKTSTARSTARSVAGKVDVQQQISKLTAEVQSLRKKVNWLESVINTQVLKRD